MASNAKMVARAEKAAKKYEKVAKFLKGVREDRERYGIPHPYYVASGQPRARKVA